MLTYGEFLIVLVSLLSDSLSEPVLRYLSICCDCSVSNFTKDLIFSKQEPAFNKRDLKGTVFFKETFSGLSVGTSEWGGTLPPRAQRVSKTQ